MSEAERGSGIDVKLLELLACPLTKGPLDLGRGALRTRLETGEACLSGARRHSGHAAVGSRAIDPNDLPGTKPAEQQG